MATPHIEPNVALPMSHVPCHLCMLHVTCHISSVTSDIYMPYVTCHILLDTCQILLIDEIKYSLNASYLMPFYLLPLLSIIPRKHLFLTKKCESKKECHSNQGYRKNVIAIIKVNLSEIFRNNARKQ